MFEKLKALSGAALGLALLLGLLAIPVIFYMGALWAAQYVLQPLVAFGWYAAGVDLIFLVLAAFKDLRSFSAGAILLSSYLFGLISWLLGLVLTYVIWGFWAVVIGLILFGGGVVPIALLATLVKGLWEPFFTLIALSVLTYGTRIGGAVLAVSAER